MSEETSEENQRPLQRRRAGGFTLIEIAVVLVIIGLITAGVIALLTSFLKTTRSRVAAENAIVVQQSLQRFIERYGRLPCPAVPTAVPGAPNYGIEDVAGCTTPPVPIGATGMARGVLPWISLGLPLDQVQDGYSRMFTYNVTALAAQAPVAPATVGAMRGNMTIHTNTPTVTGLNAPGNQLNSCWTGAAPAPAVPPENSCNMNAVVVLLSHGENGAGAYTSTGGMIPPSTVPTEAQNTGTTAAFVKSDPLATGFDDLVIGWSPDDLLDPLTRQGTVRSATAVTNDTLRNTAIAISNFMVNNTVAPNLYVIPAASPVALPLDAWGNPLVYVAPNAGNQMCATMPPGTAVPAVFTLTSIGIDGVAGLNANTGRNDDLSVSVTVDPLRNQINNRLGFTC